MHSTLYTCTQAETAQRPPGAGGQPERAADDHRGLVPHLQQPQDLPQHARDHCHQGDLRLQVGLNSLMS